MANCITLLLVETCHVDLFVALIFTQKWIWRNFLQFLLHCVATRVQYHFPRCLKQKKFMWIKQKIGLICSVQRGGFIELFFSSFVSWRDRKFLSLLARWSLLFQGGEKKKARVSFCPSSLVTLFFLVSRLAFKVVVPQRKFLFFFTSLLVALLLHFLVFCNFLFFQHKHTHNLSCFLYSSL